MFRDDVLEIIGLLRAIGWRSTSDGYARQAVAWIAERYGPVGDAATLSAALQRECRGAARGSFRRASRPVPGNKSATEALQKDFRNLRAAAEGDALDRDWKLWQSLRKLRQSKRGSALPDGYDELRRTVMTAANALPQHPGPLAHAQRHIEALLGGGAGSAGAVRAAPSARRGSSTTAT